MLEIKNLTVGYGNVMVVKEFSMSVKRGELVSLVGANGAGKTTTLKTVSGLLKARKGSIKFVEQDISRLESHQILEKGLVQVPEGRKLFPKMSVLDNLKMGAYSKRAKKNKAHNLEMIFELLPDLKQKIKQAAGTLSGGQQQMLAIGRGLMSEPELLVLDEPSIGLAPVLTQKMFSIIEEIKKQGVTILLVEQNVHHALSMADRGYVIEQGTITMEGTGEALLNNEHLKKSYLGM